jgi:hypothetical protein
VCGADRIEKARWKEKEKEKSSIDDAKKRTETRQGVKEKKKNGDRAI